VGDEVSSSTDQQEDKAIYKTFGIVMGLLTVGAVIIFAIALFAGSLDTSVQEARVQHEKDRLVARLQPVGAVRMDGDAAPVTMPRGQAEPAEAVVRTASQIYDSACMACHAAGVMNAPVTGDEDAWANLLSDKGLDELVYNAINGIRGMPARGGDSSLSDDDVRNAVVHMLEESGQSVE